MLTPPVNMGDSGDSEVGDDCPRRTLPTRDIREDSARLRDFRDSIRGVSSGWGLSRMGTDSGAVSSKGEGTLKPENNDCRGDVEST